MPLCDDCNGTKYVLNTAQCQRCAGTGELFAYDIHGAKTVIKCPHCDGGRIYVEEECATCEGTGRV